MNTSAFQTGPGRARVVLIALSLALGGGCDRVSRMLNSATESSTRLSETVADKSKAVSDAATEAAAKLGLAKDGEPGTEPVPALAEKPASRDTARKMPAPSKKKAPRPATAPEAVAKAALPAEPIAAAPEPAAELARNEPAPVTVPGETHAVMPASNPAPARRNSRIYSSEDPDVTPPVLLTTTRGGPLFQGIEADMNTMELLISATGVVEQVRLLSPTVRMTDMLLLSGAKTWKFAPALRDGEPVRYRTMFSWESTP